MAVDAFHAPPQFHRVSEIFDSFCEGHHLEILASAVDKYDSWEWSAVQEGDINRFLTFSLTAKRPGSLNFIGQILAEAERAGRMSRKQKSFRLDQSLLDSPQLEQRIADYLDWGWTQAQSFTRNLKKSPHPPLPRSSQAS
jgi:hypothetical protein